MKLVIGVIGKSGSGKDTVYYLLAEELRVFGLSVSLHHFSDPLVEALTIFGVSSARENTQKLSTFVRRKLNHKDGDKILGKVMERRILADKADIICLVGVRREMDVDMLKTLPRGYSYSLCYIENNISDQDLVERIKKRNDRPGDTEMTVEKFRQEMGAEAESQIKQIGQLAGTIFYNAGPLENFRTQIKHFIATHVRNVFCA